MRTILCALVMVAAAWAADWGGEWRLTSESSEGERYLVMLTLRQGDSGWKGEVTVDGDELELRQAEASGEGLRLEIVGEEASYEVKLSYRDGELRGTWTGSDGSKGTIGGKRVIK